MTETTLPAPDSDERALATVETIISLREIPGADLIVCARVRGWDVVVKRNEFAVGDHCLYIEVDSLLDVSDERFAFLEPRGIKTDAEGHTGHVLKTARMRGQYSQGIVFALDAFPEAAGAEVGTDVTAALGIVKWDPPIPPELLGKVRGMRPSWIQSTNENRVQNIAEILGSEAQWEATEKIDGFSATFYFDPETDWNGACTRNLDLLFDPNQAVWKMAAQHRLHEQIAATWPGRRVAVQGEIHGVGTKPNALRLPDTRFAAFTLRVDGAEVARNDWPAWLAAISVPVYMHLAFPTTVEEALAQVEKLPSNINPERAAEGVVWRAADRTTVLVNGAVLRASTKVISNKYLMKNDR